MDSGNDTTRSFICIELPDSVKEHIEDYLDSLNLNRIKRVSRENMHITLIFLGNLSQDKLGKAKEALQNINTESFFASIKGFGSFSSRSQIVLFAKVEEGGKELLELRANLFERLKRDFRLDDRSYVPHFTVARIPDLREKSRVKEFIEANSGKEFGRFLVNEIKLKKSVLAEPRPIHSDMYCKELLTATG